MLDYEYSFNFLDEMRTCPSINGCIFLKMVRYKELNHVLSAMILQTSALVIIRNATIDVKIRLADCGVILDESCESSDKVGSTLGILYHKMKDEYTSYHIRFHQFIQRLLGWIYLEGFYYFGKNQCVISLDAKPSYLGKSIHRRKIALVIKAGYGDLVMLLRLVQCFIMQHQDNCVEILTTVPRVNSFFKCYMSKIPVQLLQLPNNDWFDQMLQSCIMLNKSYYACYFITPNVVPKLQMPMHVTDVWKTVLHLDPHQETLWKNAIKFPILPKKHQEEVLRFKNSGKRCVGIQFFSQDKKRSWDYIYAKEFLKICQANNIIPINLVQNQDSIKEVCYDVSDLTFEQLPSLIRLLDAVVGVDGCCCHIAGAIEVPNITMWWSEFPTIMSIRPISFRSISMNYSIVSYRKDPLKIKPDKLYNTLTQILEKKILMKKREIMISDSLNNYNIEWL